MLHSPDDAPLSTEELLARAQGVTGDERESMLAEVVERELPLARSIAARYRDRGEPWDDLQQVASVGLVLAAQRFVPGEGASFAAYAAPTIAGEIRRYFRDHAWHLRPPRRIQELSPRVSTAVEDLTHQLQRAPSDEELAEHLGITAEDLDEVRRAAADYRPVSLQAPLEAGGTVSDLVAGDDGHLAATEDILMVEPLLVSLTKREQVILRMRFVEGASQQEIAHRIGVTQMQVSRLLSKLLDRLRAEITDDEPVN